MSNGERMMGVNVIAVPGIPNGCPFRGYSVRLPDVEGTERGAIVWLWGTPAGF